MARIVIDTDTLWKSAKTPLLILLVLFLIIIAAYIGYHIGKKSPINCPIHNSPPNSSLNNTSANEIFHNSINLTGKQPINSLLVFTDSDFKSESLRLFHKGDLIPAGTYILDVIGWNSQWNSDEGWYEEGVRDPTPYRCVAWRNLSGIWINGSQTPLSTLVNGSFDYENSWGSTTITLSSPSYVGIQINDTVFSDNRGSAIFLLSDSERTIR